MIAPGNVTNLINTSRFSIVSSKLKRIFCDLLQGLVGTVLATADESGTLTLESVSAAEVLEAIMNAGVNFDGTYPVADPEASTLPSTLLPTEAIRTPKEEVACLFHLPKPSNPANNRAKKRAITSHR